MRQCLNPGCLAPNPNHHQFCDRCGEALLLAGRYGAQRILGQGGFARTFLAVDTGAPGAPRCAIKQFLPQVRGAAKAKAAELFAREAQLLSELGRHPQIPDFWAHITAGDRQYLVQEFIDGPTLDAELAQQGPFSESAIRDLLGDLLGVLEFVHANQAIHRDIKPDNIIRRASNHQLALVDFGAAKYVLPMQCGKRSTIIGTTEYCAPEQARGKPIFASDLYSLGVTCLHLLTKASPRDLFDALEAKWVWRDRLQGNPVSPELGAILDRLVAKPRQRYQAAAEVLADLASPPPRPAAAPRLAAVSPARSSQAPRSPLGAALSALRRTGRQSLAFLVAEMPANYRQLQVALDLQQWCQADEVTAQLMLRIAGRQQEGWLSYDSIRDFPSVDLQTIDRLWKDASAGKFGFSVQKGIWLQLGGRVNYELEKQLGDICGWRQQGRWLSHSELRFDLETAPTGHLPRQPTLINPLQLMPFRTAVVLLAHPDLPAV